jgi:uncharacterized membrane protein YhaH (DUF805 family)
MIKKQPGKRWSICSGFGWSIWSGEGWSVCSGEWVVFLLRFQVVILSGFSNSANNIENPKNISSGKIGMFSNSFSFEGRIRRTEYGISFIIYVIIFTIVNLIIESNVEAAIIILAYIPLLWFLWAQGAKRCHDMGNSGWYQIIPFYVLWMIFADGEKGFINKYGRNPKI